LKGKSRGFWDELTGKGRWGGVEAQKEKAGDILSMIAGPGEMAQLRPHEVQAQVPGGGEGVVPEWAQDPSMTRLMSPDLSKGRIGLKDPKKEKLELLKAQYGLQTDAATRKLEERQELLNQQADKTREDKQAFELEKQERASSLKAEGALRARALVKARAQGRPTANEEDLTSAALEIEAEGGMKKDALLSLIGLRQATTDLKKAETNLTVSPSGEYLGKPMTQGQRQSLDMQQQQQGQRIFDEWSKSRAEAIEAGQQLQNTYNQLMGAGEPLGLLYDAQKNSFVRKDGKALSDVDGFMVQRYAPLIKQASEFASRKAAAQAQMADRYRLLKSNYPEYYSAGPNEWWIEPSKQFGGVAPAGAPRTYDGTDKGGTKTGNIADMIEVKGSVSKPASMYKVGEILNQGGKRYKVSAVNPTNDAEPNGSVILVPIK